MGSIRDIHNAWRDELLPARFRKALFHCESAGRDSGRRIVMHEFPKKDLPYAEDMGKRTTEFTVRGYCITFPVDTDVELYKKDYRRARNLLAAALEEIGPGTLQLPTLPPMIVVCPRYRLTEEDRLGGYCTFDMTFQEYGMPVGQSFSDSRGSLIQEAQAMRQRVVGVLDGAAAGKLQRSRDTPKKLRS